jgi:hypothetical protein
MTVPLPREPTAKQFDLLRHATPLSDVDDGSGSTLADLVQCTPSQRLMNECMGPLNPYIARPTAKQADVVEHVTALKELSLAFDGSLLATVCQLVPCQSTVHDLVPLPASI